MNLIGKCKEDFDYWFEREYSHCPIYDYWINEDLGISIQFSVYVDFAEKFAQDNNQVNHILKLQRIYYLDMNYSLHESRLIAVFKFNLIYNQF